jgi:hypothetical protein
LKPEWWGSPLVQEVKVPEKTCEKKREEEMMMINLFHWFYWSH